MNEYKISIIIPTFNSSKTIGRLIHSILSQDFTDFEIIFIDDASEDDTIECIHDNLDGFKDYKIIVNKTNKGPAYSRNRGIMEAGGKNIVFVDSDDMINYNHLSSLYKHMKKDEFDAVFTKGIKLDDEDKLFDFKVEKFDPLLLLAKESKGVLKAEELIMLELTMQIPFYFVLLIYDRDIIIENGLKFNEAYRYAEDTDFALRYLANCNYIRVIDKYTYFYYQEKESISKSASLSRFESVELFESLYLYFKKKNGALADLVLFNRIPKFIFGNMNYFFANGYNKDEVFNKMSELGLFEKLKRFNPVIKSDRKFKIKIKMFLTNPSLYYKLWMNFKK